MFVRPNRDDRFKTDAHRELLKRFKFDPNTGEVLYRNVTPIMRQTEDGRLVLERIIEWLPAGDRTFTHKGERFSPERIRLTIIAFPE